MNELEAAALSRIREMHQRDVSVIGYCEAGCGKWPCPTALVADCGDCIEDYQKIVDIMHSLGEALLRRKAQAEATQTELQATIADNEQLRREWDWWRRGFNRITSERDEALAALQRVRELRDGWQRAGHNPVSPIRELDDALGETR